MVKKHKQLATYEVKFVGRVKKGKKTCQYRTVKMKGSSTLDVLTQLEQTYAQVGDIQIERLGK